MIYILVLLATVGIGGLLWAVMFVDAFTPRHFLDDTKDKE